MLHEREFVSLEPGSKTQSLSDRFVADSPLGFPLLVTPAAD
jgi:hypothetical protein